MTPMFAKLTIPEGTFMTQAQLDQAIAQAEADGNKVILYDNLTPQEEEVYLIATNFINKMSGADALKLIKNLRDLPDGMQRFIDSHHYLK